MIRGAIGIVAVALLAAACGGGGGDGQSETTSTPPTSNVATTAPPSTSTTTATTSPSAAEPPASEPPDDLPEFEIESEFLDRSFTVVAPSDDETGQYVVRAGLVVKVPTDTTKAQLQAIAVQLSMDHRDEHEYHALEIAFFRYAALRPYLRPLGLWIDAPFGDYSRAHEAEAGDYSLHEVVDSTREKDWDLLPTESEVEIYLAYWAAHDELYAETDEPPTEEEIGARAARNLDMNPAEVAAAVDAVVTWSAD